MTLATILGGVCALLFGRQLFWLFVGVVGFVAGTQLATTLYAGAPPLVVLALALAAGIVGAVLAYVMQEVMIGIAGFVAGSVVASQVLFGAVPLPGRSSVWLALLVGGVIGMVLFLALFDWAVIVMSSIFGAGVIVRALDAGPAAAPLVILGLALVGIIIQARALRRLAGGT